MMLTTEKELHLGETPPVEADQWFVLRTKSRNEKALATELESKGITCFLPLCRQVRFSGGRKSVSQLPLIPGYVFLRGTVDEAYIADRSDRTAQLIKVVDQAKLSWELENLRVAIERGADLAAFPALVVGTRVEIRSGPLRGIQGIVDDRKGSRLVLQISALGQAVSLEIDGSILDRLN
jgi:transcriptional antiterminator RfaH